MSLLDFDDFPSDITSTPAGQEKDSNPSADPFDPFGMSTTTTQPAVESTTAFDAFDPFGGDLLSPSQNDSTSEPQQQTSSQLPQDDPFGLGDIGGDSDPFSAANSTKPESGSGSLDLFGSDSFAQYSEPANMADPASLEAQFDDLMVDFSTSKTSTTETTQIENEDGVTVTTTTTTVTENQLMNGVENGHSEQSASEQSLSDREDAQPRVEDTLSDYQPPKRYVKQEQITAQETKAPGLFVTHDAGTESRASRQSRGKPWSRPALGAGGDNQCSSCNKRVYEMEKLIVDKGIYHKHCFKCSHCSRTLTMTNFAALQGILYCKPHFKALFKTKGNYDEGFGREKHSKNFAQEQKTKQPQKKIDTPAPLDKKPQEKDDEPDDEPWEEIEALPSISSLKSRFEGDSQKSGQVNGPVSTQQASKQSTKQKEVRAPSPVEAVVPDIEDEGETELPPVDYTRNMVARFSQISNSTEPEQPSKKSVRKMTPPREEIQKQEEQTIQASPPTPEVVRSSDAQDDDLPPPAVTRTMMAKFQTMPSPESSGGNTSRISRSRESSVSNTPSHTPSQTSSVLSPDPEDETEEMPRQGLTRSLLSQWKSLELETVPSSSTPTKQKDVRRNLSMREYSSSQAQRNEQPIQQSTRVSLRTSTPKSTEQVEEEVDSRLTTSETSPENELPPPAYTKTMLAKFQGMQSEPVQQKQQQQQKQPQKKPQSGKKPFRWQVKEVQPFNRGAGPDHDYKTSDYSQDQSYTDQQVQDEEIIEDTQPDISDITYESNTTYERDNDLPPPAMTKTLLARFQSLEDVSKPPPTPEQSTRLQKEAVASTKVTPSSSQYSGTSSFKVAEQMEQNGYEVEDEYAEEEVLLEGGEWENTPQQSDMVRESDYNDVLPEQGTTRNLLAKFQSLQGN